MTEEYEDDDVEQSKGLPGWMATFADMMALLMCFFVLLLSYSEMDVEKFKRVAGEMKNAFGVQNEIDLDQTPLGETPIFDNFTPQSGEPDPIDIIEQSTVDSSQQYIDRSVRERILEEALMSAQQRYEQEVERRGQEQMDRLETALKSELEQGLLELERNGQQITFRILEQGSFSSASAFLQPRFKPIIAKITGLLNDIPGQVTVSGHTDDQPVNREMFDSNWDLSAQRALAVATQMRSVNDFDISRMTVSGHASNEPLNDAKTQLARQANRRVEIVVNQGEPKQLDPIDLLKQAIKE